jgi:tetratricopeptide (TPR) repeat protein
MNLGSWVGGLNPPRYAEALSYFRAAEAIRPQNSRARENVGWALRSLGRLDEAIDCFKKAIELDPKSVSAHNYLGIALHDQKKLDEAITCYQKAIALDPKYALAHNNLGAALSKQGKVNDAIACYKKGIELDPKNVLAHHNLGLTLKKLGRLEEAIGCYEQAIKHHPDHANFRDNLAWLLATSAEAKGRNPAEAVVHAKKAVELAPKDSHPWLTLGVAQYRAREWEAAKDALQKSMDRWGGGYALQWFVMAMTHWQLGDKVKAREFYNRAVDNMDKYHARDEGLRRFRQEAEELLGINKKES